MNLNSPPIFDPLCFFGLGRYGLGGSGLEGAGLREVVVGLVGLFDGLGLLVVDVGLGRLVVVVMGPTGGLGTG